MAKVYKELRDTKGRRLNEHLYKRRLLFKSEVRFSEQLCR